MRRLADVLLVAFCILMIGLMAAVTGCGAPQTVKPEDGPVWYEVVWSESDTGQRYMNLCERFGLPGERCVEVDELPDGCEISVDWHGEVRCEAALSFTGGE